MSCVKLNSRWFFLLYNFIYICIFVKRTEANKMQMKWHGSVFIIHRAGLANIYCIKIEIIIFICGKLKKSFHENLQKIQFLIPIYVPVTIVLLRILDVKKKCYFNQKRNFLPIIFPTYFKYQLLEKEKIFRWF